MKNRWVKLGIVGKAFGLDGAFFISGREQPIPKTVRLLHIGKKPEMARTLTVLNSRMQGKRPILVSRELQSRDEVESIKGQLIWCARQEIEVQEDQEYIWADLEGKTVVDQQGRFVGTIVGVQNYGASDIVELKNESLGTLSLPFVDFYFDMNFRSNDEQLRLLVPIETFAEAWQS